MKLTQSFALEEKMGKKCFMIGARGLSIAGLGEEEDALGYWRWTTVPASRYVRTYSIINQLPYKCHQSQVILIPGFVKWLS